MTTTLWVRNRKECLLDFIKQCKYEQWNAYSEIRARAVSLFIIIILIVVVIIIETCDAKVRGNC